MPQARYKHASSIFSTMHCEFVISVSVQTSGCDTQICSFASEVLPKLRVSNAMDRDILAVLDLSCKDVADTQEEKENYR